MYSRINLCLLDIMPVSDIILYFFPSEFCYFPLDACLVTSCAYGLVPQRLPVCPIGSGSAALQPYHDQSCAVPETSSVFANDNCYDFGTFGISAVMFMCGSVALGKSDTTSEITVIAASALVPVAQPNRAITASTSSGLSPQTDTNEPISSSTMASS